MRIQEVVPYVHPGIRFAVLRGPVHEVRALAKRLERRGRIRILGQGVTYLQGGRILAAVPYAPRHGGLIEWYRRRALMVAGVVVMGAGLLVAIGAALWEMRFTIMGAGSLIFGVFCLWRLLRHDPGCTGLHCSGCRG